MLEELRINKQKGKCTDDVCKMKGYLHIKAGGVLSQKRIR